HVRRAEAQPLVPGHGQAVRGLRTAGSGPLGERLRHHRIGVLAVLLTDLLLEGGRLAQPVSSRPHAHEPTVSRRVRAAARASCRAVGGADAVTGCARWGVLPMAAVLDRPYPAAGAPPARRAGG